MIVSAHMMQRCYERWLAQPQEVDLPPKPPCPVCERNDGPYGWNPKDASKFYDPNPYGNWCCSAKCRVLFEARSRGATYRLPNGEELVDFFGDRKPKTIYGDSVSIHGNSFPIGEDASRSRKCLCGWRKRERYTACERCLIALNIPEYPQWAHAVLGDYKHEIRYVLTCTQCHRLFKSHRLRIPYCGTDCYLRARQVRERENRAEKRMSTEWASVGSLLINRLEKGQK